jgi:hypothetical protein
MKNKTWNKTPICEVCGKEPATSFSWIDGDWKFCGDCTADSEIYYVELRLFFHSPAATVDWLAHLAEKDWVDWRLFMDMMTRFREATESFNQTNG